MPVRGGAVVGGRVFVGPNTLTERSAEVAQVLLYADHKPFVLWGPTVNAEVDDVELDSDALPEQLDKLLHLTERYCVVFQTLRHPPAITSAIRSIAG